MSRYDVIVIGAGPAGSTSALLLARQGFKVVVLEKAKFPRFHIGESILPRNFPLVQELGLEKALERLPHLKKYGAEFGMGDDQNTTRFYFDSGLIPGSRTFNVERSLFDCAVREGAVDGMSGRTIAVCDGVPVAQHMAVVHLLREIFRAQSARDPSPFSTPLIRVSTRASSANPRRNS